MNSIVRFFREEDAVGVVEIILIIVVLISLVVIFRDQLTSIVQRIFNRISSDSSAV
ncbi:MAG: holin, BlyA family protein [Lachnospiraceae bacterium]|nr:holin, BlyA family protein [Lachnospiraceae bacterium]